MFPPLLEFVAVVFASSAAHPNLSDCTPHQNGCHAEGAKGLCDAVGSVADDCNDDNDVTILLQKSFSIPSANQHSKRSECQEENCNIFDAPEDDDVLMLQKSFHLPLVQAQVDGAKELLDDLAVDVAPVADGTWRPLEATRALVRRAEKGRDTVTAKDIQDAVAHLQASLEPKAFPADVKQYNEVLERIHASIASAKQCNADLRSGAQLRRLLYQNVSEFAVQHDACLTKEAGIKAELKECRSHHPARDCRAIGLRFQDLECDSTQLARDEAECSYITHANRLCETYKDCRAVALESHSAEKMTFTQVEAESRDNRRLLGVAKCIAKRFARKRVRTEQDVVKMFTNCQASAAIHPPDETMFVISPPMKCNYLPCPDGLFCPCAVKSAQAIPAEHLTPVLWLGDTASWIQESAMVVSARQISNMSLTVFNRHKGGSRLPMIMLFLAIPFTLLCAVLCVALINARDRTKEGSDEHIHFHAAAEASQMSGLKSNPWSMSSKDPASAPALPSAATATGGNSSNERSVTLSRALGPCLCPELIVPNNNECVLIIPSLAKAMRGEVVLRNITNKAGHPLLHVGLTSAPAGVTPLPSSLSEYVLLVKKDQKELAFCELTPEASNAGWKGQIFRWNGELYARLREDDVAKETSSAPTSGDLRSFVVVPAHGNAWELRIHGSFKERKLSVVNEARQVIAMVTPGDDLTMTKQGGEFYKLRLGPQADSCMIIVSLLAIERLLMASAPGA